MKEKNVFAFQVQNPTLRPLQTALKEAKVFSPPEPFKTQTDVDEELASSFIEKVKKQHRRPSPFANWWGQPFPHEYKEMVAADVR